MIYAFHGQKLVDWTNELVSFLSKNDLQHLSLYQLTIEEGTKFFKDYKNGLIEVIDNDLVAEFYDISNDIISDFKFIKYEILTMQKKVSNAYII